MAEHLDNDVFFSSITEITAKLRAKEFSAVELTRAFCDRLEKIGPGYNALALSLRKPALKKAKDVDGDLKRQRYRPLQGIPYGVKDLLAVRGHPTTWGAKPYADQMFDQDAAIVDKLDKAGAILIGKLAMVELAGGPGYRFASASLTGPGPLIPGIEPVGAEAHRAVSGIATAAGLVTFAIGSETCRGLILTPAALLRHHRPSSDLRPSQPSRRHGALLDPRQNRPPRRSAEDCGFVLHKSPAATSPQHRLRRPAASGTTPAHSPAIPKS